MIQALRSQSPGQPVLIRGGLVADGTGAPLVRRDVLVTGGRVRQLLAPGTRPGSLPGPDGRVFDAGGLVVSPGFIDLHSHADYTVEREAAAVGQLAQGVTSIVTGNCGWSPFPVVDLAALKEWSAFLGGAASYAWHDTAGFSSQVDAARPAINVLPLVGHSPVRIAVLGGAHRQATDRELSEMRGLVTQSIEQGGWGLSTGLIYAPGSFASSDEVAALVQAAAAQGAMYATHVRDETGRVLEAVDEAIAAAEAARSAGTTPRLQVSHVKAMGPANHGVVPRVLDRISDARAGGLDVAADVYPYTASGTTLASRLSAWALDGGLDELCARLEHDETRARILEELEARFARGDFSADGIVINSLSHGQFSEAVGSSLTEIASELRVSPADAALTLLAAHGGVIGIVNHAMSEDDVRAAIAHPLVAIASDGGPLVPSDTGTTHPRAFGTFPRVFARYVREQGLISIEEAVRKCTSLPAQRLGLRDRGVLREGAIADITVFDPAAIVDLADFAHPWRLAEGVQHVLVNGRLAWSDGRATDVRAGGVLRRTAP